MKERDPVIPKILSACFYAISSVGIMFINKIVLSTYGFPSFAFLGLGQMLSTILILFIAKIIGLIKYPEISYETLIQVFPLPLLYAVNVVAGLGGTQKLNLPMFTVMRRFSILMTMIAEYLVLNVKASKMVSTSVLLMIFGAVVAALNDLLFDAYGYALIQINNLCTAAIGVYTKKKLNTKELGQYGLMFYNNFFIFPVTAVIFWFTGDVEIGMQFDGWSNLSFCSLFFLSCICGSILNYSMILCTLYNSALTMTCVGAMKNLVVTYVGMIFGGNYIFTPVNFLGINISVLGSLLYSYAVFGRRTSSASLPVKSPSSLVIHRTPTAAQERS